ncbi:Alpha glucosidase/alpha-xylosidase (modular protein) [uncultured Paludibacter sp.]|nr:Alpha glucosidase/alpha-xylosidase (modular protein) [uncultured Paludibacter sp.]
MKSKKNIFLFLILLITHQFIYAGVNKQNNEMKDTLPADSNIVLPPAWAFGILYGGYTNQNQTIARIQNIIKHNYPIDAYWIDSWFWSFADKGSGPKKYIDFVADTVDFPHRKIMWDFMRKNNIKGGFWIWDCIFQKGNEDVFNDFDSKDFFRNKYIEYNLWHNNSTTTAMFQTEEKHEGTLCGNIDFNNPEAVKYFKQKMKPFFDEGADFLKLDRTPAIEVCKTMFELSQEYGKETEGRGFILSHTGGQENETYKRYPAKWTDDTRSDWTIEKPTKDFNSWVPRVAFKENVAMFTDSTKKSSKIPFLANDLGGFDMGKTDVLDEELYIRWMEFSMFTPIVEVFSQPENITSNMAFAISERADTLFKKYSHLRMKLFPYIYSYSHRVRLESKQMMQSVENNPYDYFFGNEMYVAPVYEQFAVKRNVTLPQGNWINYWTNETLQGGEKLEIDAPINQIPLFVPQGAIIPMRNYYSSIEKGNNDTLFIHIYPGNSGTFTLIEDDGTSNDYLKGIFAKTKIHLIKRDKSDQLIIKPVAGEYNGMKMERRVKIIVHQSKKIKSITINKKNVFNFQIGNIAETKYCQLMKDKTTIFSIFYK